jgi:hypothetical protein
LNTQHALVTRLGLLLLSATAATALADQPPASNERGQLEVGDRRQLLFDRRFIQEAKGVELVVHKPVKTGEWTIKPERPWEEGGVGPYSSVLKEGDTYHMWYHVMTSVQWHIDEEAGAVCYARSKDGIHWERPSLGLVEFAGSRDNNIVFGHGAAGVTLGQDGGMVFIDPNAPPDERFRLLIRHKKTGEGLHLFSAPDGIHFKLTHTSLITYRPQARGHHLDSQNVMFWDDRLGGYVAYVRKNMNEPGSQGRAIARTESARLGGFPVVQEMPAVVAPDAQDLKHNGASAVDYYMSATIKYPWAQDAYFMFPTAYYHYMRGFLGDFPDEVPTNAGPLDSQFAASRDGINWERYDRRPFVDLGMKGEFDWASARVIHGIVPDTSGRSLYMYYRASDWLHGWDRDERNKKLLTQAGLGADQNIAVLSRVVLRMDGFVSVRGAYTGGEFTTPPLTFKGGKLVLNVDTSATGIVQVGLMDQDGQPIDGFQLDQCDLIHTANDVNRPVTWKGKGDLAALAGKPVRLRFAIRNADLYAFQFRP